jgi:hypothetical protein
MRTAVIVGPIAVTTEYWEESQEDGTQETGCRVELRRVRQTPPAEPPPRPRLDAVSWLIAEHLWRADLFSIVGGTRPYDAAHYHPTFEQGVPSDRHLEGRIDDPYTWMAARLEDVPQILDEAGHGDLAAELDAEALRQAMPAILASIRATLDYRPTHPWSAPSP